MARRYGTEHSQKAFDVKSAALVLFPVRELGRDVFIQNNDDVGIVYVNLSGDAVATDAGMIVILPEGGSTTIPDTKNAVSIIGSIATNPNVTVSEGKWRAQ